MIPPPAGGDRREYQQMADLLLQAVDTGRLHPDLQAFYMRTLGYDRDTVVGLLADLVAGMRRARGLPPLRPEPEAPPS